MEEQPTQYQEWYLISQHIGFLSVKDLESLEQLCSRLSGLNISFSCFNEPDLGNALTAIVVEPTSAATRHLSAIPLAMKEFNQPQYAMTG